MRRAQGIKHVVQLVAGGFGVAIGRWIDSGFAILDVPAEPGVVLFASVMVLGLALLRGVSSWILLYAAVACLSTLGSYAVGSSWAGVTWLPVILAVFELARLSNVFMIALTGTLLMQGAPSLALQQGSGSSGSFSGSSAYFIGFVGAVAAPIWFRLSLRPPLPWWGRVVAAAAVLVSALAVWSVIASGSRAALLALMAGTAIMPIARLLTRVAPWVGVGRTVRSTLVVLLLVPVIELGLGATFVGTIGGSSLYSSLADSLEDSVSDASLDAPNSFSTRLALWRQAAEAMLQRPLGHGLASYSHVNLAYQHEPMLWSGSPHSIWALIAVELGVPGLIALVALVVIAFRTACRSDSSAASALVAATVVMSFDIFSSMPLYALVWWSAVGTASGGQRDHGGFLRSSNILVVVAVLFIAGQFAHRLNAPCEQECDSVVQYGGHPRLAGAELHVLGITPRDERWVVWQERYPLAFWLLAARVVSMSTDEPRAELLQLQLYPYHSAETYIRVARAVAPSEISVDVASCGLIRFFDGKPIWRDWRSSAAELASFREELHVVAEGLGPDEEACRRVGIPDKPVGFSSRTRDRTAGK